MTTTTEQIVKWNIEIESLTNQLKGARHLRDHFICVAFFRGERQATLASLSGLSVSTVKHIIERGKENLS